MILGAERTWAARSRGLTVRTRPAIADLAREWDGLVDRSSTPLPFLRSWWLDPLLEGSGRVASVFDGSALVGGLALRSGMLRRCLPALKEPLLTDYSEILAEPAARTEVMAVLGAWLSHQTRHRLIDFRGVRRRGLLCSLLPSKFSVPAANVCPWDYLPGTFAAYMDSRSRRWRANVRQALHSGERHGAEVTVVDSPNAAAEGLATFFRLHKAQRGLSPLVRFQARFEDVARAGIARKEMVILELRLRNEVVASQVWLEMDGCSYYFQGGRSSSGECLPSFGTILIAAALERACQLGHDRFNLLTGAEPYKAHWASRTDPVFHARAVRLPMSLLFSAASAAHKLEQGSL